MTNAADKLLVCPLLTENKQICSPLFLLLGKEEGGSGQRTSFLLASALSYCLLLSSFIRGIIDKQSCKIFIDIVIPHIFIFFELLPFVLSPAVTKSNHEFLASVNLLKIKGFGSGECSKRRPPKACELEHFGCRSALDTGQPPATLGVLTL